MKLLLILLVEAVSVDIDEVGLHIVSIRACHHGEVVQGALTCLTQVPQVRARMPPPGRLNLIARNAQEGKGSSPSNTKRVRSVDGRIAPNRRHARTKHLANVGDVKNAASPRVTEQWRVCSRVSGGYVHHVEQMIKGRDER